METASNGDKDESQQIIGAASKTYESLLMRKEARIAKEAQFERRARVLTKHFLREHEQKESHKLDHLHEASQRSYERSMAKVKDGFNSDAMMREMFREENHQINQLMQERARQRELEEEKLREKKAEREFYMQARIVHSQLQAEERQRKVEEIQQQRAQEIKERMRSNTERVKEAASTDKTETVSTAVKYDDEQEKVIERRRLQNIQSNKDRQEKLSARANKEQKALAGRQRRVEKMQQEIREAEEERHRKVQERKRQEEEALFKKVEQMNARGLALDVQGSSRGSPASKPPPQECRPRIPTVNTERERTETDVATHVESPKGEDRKVLRSCVPSKELIESNNRAQKDYVLRAKGLDDTLERMNVDKRYKVLAEGASGIPDDYREARLRAVHQRNMSAKTKAPVEKKTVDLAEASGSDASHSASPRRQVTQDTQGQTTARRTPRALRCGLCMREFPPDRLVGSALRRTVEKMRNQSANLPNNKGEMSSPRQYPSEGESCDRTSARLEDPVEAAAPKGPSVTKKRSLYDYEVKLCVNCDIFVRITSS